MKKITLIIATLLLIISSITPTFAEDQGELFIGLIEEVDGDYILVDPLFFDSENIDENKTIRIKKDPQSDLDYPVGYIVSLYYDEYTFDQDVYTITANDSLVVEENSEGVYINSDDTTNIEDSQEVIVCEMEPTFFEKIIMFLKIYSKKIKLLIEIDTSC